MEAIYAVQVERVVKKNMASKNCANVFPHDKKQMSYLCMISPQERDPLIMYTEDLKSAVYYTPGELAHVRSYLIEHNITFVITDVKAKKQLDLNQTNVKRRRTSLLDFI